MGQGAVIVTLEIRPAQLNALYTACMDMFIKDQLITGFEKSGNDPDVRLISAWKKQAILIPEMMSIPLFRLSDS
jgi:hypothetical protein